MRKLAWASLTGFAAAALTTLPAHAGPLPIGECMELRTELQTLDTDEKIRSTLDAGPHWAKEHLSEEELALVHHYVALEETVRFRCPIEREIAATPPVPEASPHRAAKLTAYEAIAAAEAEAERVAAEAEAEDKARAEAAQAAEEERLAKERAAQERQREEAEKAASDALKRKSALGPGPAHAAAAADALPDLKPEQANKRLTPFVAARAKERLRQAILSVITEPESRTEDAVPVKRSPDEGGPIMGAWRRPAPPAAPAASEPPPPVSRANADIVSHFAFPTLRPSLR